VIAQSVGLIGPVFSAAFLIPLIAGTGFSGEGAGVATPFAVLVAAVGTAELGWIVAEYGRQPWAIDGVLPTALGVSSVSAAQVATSLTGFVVFYTALLVVDIVLMRKYIRLGPDGLGMWRSEPVTPPYLASAD